MKQVALQAAFLVFLTNAAVKVDGFQVSPLRGVHLGYLKKASPDSRPGAILGMTKQQSNGDETSIETDYDNQDTTIESTTAQMPSQHANDLPNAEPFDSLAPFTNMIPEDLSPVQDFLGSALSMTVEGSKIVLSALRWAAANALTASLPDDERNKLLSRMQNRSMETSLEVEQDEIIAERGSVQEEIATAEREEAYSAEKWELEKERITKQMEEAANARVETELAIQQQQLEKEKLAMQEQLETKNTKLVQQVESLRELQAKAQEEAKQAHVQAEAIIQEKEQLLKEMAAVATKEQEQRAVAEQQEGVEKEAKARESLLEAEREQAKELEAALEKRKQQQAELEAVEKDLERRTREIQMEKQDLAKMAESQDQVPHLSPKEYRSLSQEEKAELKAQRDAVKTEDAQDDVEEGDSSKVHPVLGPVVSDLGYKRIHLVSSGKLGTIPIWKRQRSYSNARAKTMAKDKLKSMDLGFPGVIVLHEDTSGRLSIVDGQHRIGMMQAIRAIRNKQEEQNVEEDAMFDKVLVEVFPEKGGYDDNNKHAEKVFMEINKAEPIKLIDMPGVASAADRKIINEAIQTIQTQFPKFFSPSQRCKSPNVNQDNLRNAIFGANILKRHNLTTSKQLVSWLVRQNSILGDLYENDKDGRRKFVRPKAWDKASAMGFYLGLESSWLYS